VLSTVQSSIGAGQDASLTLSRLMDWAEAREVSPIFLLYINAPSIYPHPCGLCDGHKMPVGIIQANVV
jgi:hypothetical protein